MVCPSTSVTFKLHLSSSEKVMVVVVVKGLGEIRISDFKFEIAEIPSGPEDTTEHKLVAESPAQAALVQLPDSPSEEVFTVIHKLAPVIALELTVISQQKFHCVGKRFNTQSVQLEPSPKLFPGSPS